MAISRLDLHVAISEIQRYLAAGKKVYIESGAANDRMRVEDRDFNAALNLRDAMTYEVA